MHELPCTSTHMLKAREWQIKQYENASIKPGSQYDAHASVASRTSGWHWNRLDFYSSVASRALASIQPIRLPKNLMSEIQFDWWKNTFSFEVHNTCGASFILWTRLYRLSSKVSKCVVNLGSKISTHMYRMYMYSSILGTLYTTTQQLVCWVPCCFWSFLHIGSVSWIEAIKMNHGAVDMKEHWVVMKECT